MLRDSAASKTGRPLLQLNRVHPVVADKARRLRANTPVAVDEPCEATSGRAAAVKRPRSKDRSLRRLLHFYRVHL